MKVKALKGTGLKQYTVILPDSSEISDLPQELQLKIKAFGDLKVVKRFGIDPEDSLYSETVQNIEQNGAHLWKLNIEFKEIH